MNKVILSGRLSQEPEKRVTAGGKTITTFTVAVSRKTGTEEQVDFIPVVTWEQLAETCSAHLTRGRLVLVEGRLQIRNYITAAGEKRRLSEVVASAVEFLDRPPRGEDADFSSMGEEIPF